ncbi:MAG: rhodanese-like domain-containing protein [Desulfuromonadaceae bacterium]|nr:rhodanese-like domain-containing protein [Desulfuromonadaceae bacterium]
MRKLLLMVLVGFLSVLLTSTTALAAGGYQEIDAAETKALMEKEGALVVFPLSPIEFDNKHIKGSVNIVMDKLATDLPADKNRKLVFYCLGTTCVASWRAAEKAVELGYKNVYAFREGIPAWQAAGYPMVTVKPLPDVAVKKISTGELASMLANDDITLVDINLNEDAHKFYIDNAKRVHIPLDELNSRLAEIPRDKKIVVICLKGKRSATAVKYLTGQGYTDVVMVRGGLQQWVLDGRRVKRTN